MRALVLLAGRELGPLVAIAAAFDRAWSPYFLQSHDPVERLSSAPVAAARAAVVILTGDENVVEIRALLDAHPQAHFVFLAPEFPPHAAIARIVHEHEGTIFHQGEAPFVVVATLVTMLAASLAV